jgi:hypothetical protein
MKLDERGNDNIENLVSKIIETGSGQLNQEYQTQDSGRMDFSFSDWVFGTDLSPRQPTQLN